MGLSKTQVCIEINIGRDQCNLPQDHDAAGIKVLCDGVNLIN